MLLSHESMLTHVGKMYYKCLFFIYLTFKQVKKSKRVVQFKIHLNFRLMLGIYIHVCTFLIFTMGLKLLNFI